MADPAARPAPPADPRLPRRRLAALSLVGALMVALPLGQVLRYQNSEQQTLAERRAVLDPIARAVDVQRGLLVHGTLAAAVLGGRLTAEPERRMRQGEVDTRLATLGATLVAGPWALAERERDALVYDWALLAHQVGQRRCSAAESDASHRLRVEQVLQIIDLLADALAPVSTDEAAVPAWHAARQLPRQAARLAAAGHEDWPAQLALFDNALQALGTDIDARRTHVTTAQRSLLAALLALAVGQMCWLRRLWRDTAPASPRTPSPDDDYAAGTNRDRLATGQLLQRLRRGEDTAAPPLDTR